MNQWINSTNVTRHDIDPDFIAAKANPSFRDGTHPSSYAVDYAIALLKAQPDELIQLANSFTQDLQHMMSAINENDAEYLQQATLEAQIARNTMPGPRKGDAVREEYEIKRELA